MRSGGCRATATALPVPAAQGAREAEGAAFGQKVFCERQNDATGREKGGGRGGRGGAREGD